MAKGIIKRYDFRKGFGFIADDKNGEDYFFHKSAWQGGGPIKRDLAVEFTAKESEKGPQAESVVPLVDNSSNISNKASAKAISPPPLEERIAILEGSVKTWKTISILTLVAVITLGVAGLVL